MPSANLSIRDCGAGSPGRDKARVKERRQQYFFSDIRSFTAFSEKT
jgi:hypothetical protein